MSTRTSSLSLSQNFKDKMVGELVGGTAHRIDHRILPPGCNEFIEPELRGKLLYIISGLGDILSEKNKKLRSFTGGKVYYLPYDQVYKIENTGSETLKYLVVAQEQPDRREKECGLEKPSLLFRYFREGEKHYEGGGIFIQNELNPHSTPLQLPVFLSDFSLDEGKRSKWTVVDRNICHVILEGDAKVRIESFEPTHLKEGEKFVIPKGVAWQIKNIGIGVLNVATVQDVSL